MGDVDFSDSKAATAWLKAQSVEVRCAISSRAALRVCANLYLISEESVEDIVLVSFRAILVSAVRSVCGTADVEQFKKAAIASNRFSRSFSSHSAPAGFFAAEVALNSAKAAHSTDAVRHAGNVDHVALVSASLAGAAIIGQANSASISQHSAQIGLAWVGNPADLTNADASSHEAALLATSFDADRKDITSFRFPLWQGAEIPEAITAAHAEFLKYLDERPDVWGFWRNWYVAMWEGKPIDWEFATRVAKLPNEIWEAGVEGVAGEINFDTEIAKFKVDPLPIAKPDLLGATLTQVEDALEDVLATVSNGLHENSREVRVIRRTISKYGNNPQQIEMGFVSAHLGLTRQMSVEELPNSEENLALQSGLE